VYRVYPRDGNSAASKDACQVFPPLSVTLAFTGKMARKIKQNQTQPLKWGMR
jgi:hypothetical protein